MSICNSGSSFHFPPIKVYSDPKSNSTKVFRHQPGSLFFSTASVRSPNIRMSALLKPLLQSNPIPVKRVQTKSPFDKKNPDGSATCSGNRIILLPLDRERQPTQHCSLKTKESKREYLEYLRKEIDRRKKEKLEEEARLRDPVIGLARLMAESRGGRPRRNEVTGELLDQKLPSTDVTSILIRSSDARRKRLQYYEELEQQTRARKLQERQRIEDERKEAYRHFEAYENIWGKPGNGAPRDSTNHKRINLWQMLIEK